jgi:DNA-binding Xre family transcriptional regulator
MKRHSTISQQLRLAIRESELSQRELAQKTGLQDASLSHFMHGQWGLRLENVDELCRVLKLKLTKESE